jgi:transposase
MNYVGIDLHKKTIVLCVLDQDRRVVARRSFPCCDREAIVAFFRGIRPFQAVVEATASYEWLVEAIEPLADRVVLAHPGRIHEIARGKKKTDHHDAFVLAEKLAKDEVPPAHRPTPRQRQHRALVRHRQHLKQSATALKNRMRRIAADYNADRKDLFSAAGWEALTQVALRDEERFVLEQLHAQWRYLEGQLLDLAQRLQEFAAKAPKKEAEARAKLRTVPGVGPVTIDVVISELGDVGRFHSAKGVCAYAGLVPGVRQSSDKRKDLPITKAGSPILRWALVEAAWRAVGHSAAWQRVYTGIRKRSGAKKAIVAVARRLLCVLYAMMRDGTNYDFLKVGSHQPT